VSALVDSATFMTRIAFHLGPAVTVSNPESFFLRPHDEDFQDVLREIRRARVLVADGLVVELVREGNLALCLLKRQGELLRGLPVSLVEPT